MKRIIAKQKYKTNLIIVLSVILTLLSFLYLLLSTHNMLISYNYSDFRSYLEVIYFISSPALLIVSIVALRQINVTVSSIEITSKRDATKLAAEQCKQFFECMVPYSDELYNFEKKIGLKTYGSVTNIKDIKGSFSCTVNISQKVIDNLDELFPYLEKTLNAFEAFSMYLNSGVVEEELVFGSVGYTFCITIERLFPVIIYLSDDKYLKNIIKLYNHWNSKINIIDNIEKLKNSLDSHNNYQIQKIGYNS